MGSRPRFRSPCVTAPAHLLPYAPLYPLLPVLTRCAASYPPGLAALCRVPAVLRGLRLARSPLAIASRRPRSSPNPGYRLPARSAAPFLPAPAHLLPCGVAAYYLPPLLSPSAGWAVALFSSPLPARLRSLSPSPPGGLAALSLFPLLSPSAGWGGALGAAERAGRCYPRFGAERHPPARVSGAGGARRVDRGRGECPPHSAELRSLRDQPLAPARASART